MKCLSIHNQGKRAEVLIYDTIGSDPYSNEGVSAKKFIEELNALGNLDEIVVRINSPGGSIFDADAIYNALVRNTAKVIVEIDGLAASAASWVAQAGDEIFMAENAMLMIHNAQGMVIGDHNDMLAMADLLEKLTARIAATYASRSGRRVQTFREAMDRETWYTAEEALEARLVDSIRPAKKVAAVFDLSRFKNAPPAWIESMRAAVDAAEAADAARRRRQAEAQEVEARLRILELDDQAAGHLTNGHGGT